MEREEVLKGKIGLRLVIAAKLTRTYAIQKFYAEKYEITPEQFTILATLIEHDGLYQRQIGAITLKDRPNITRLTRILEGMGLITKQQDSNKRKVYKIFITDKGRQMYEKVLPTVIDLWGASIDGISTEEINACLQTLHKIKSNLEELVNIQI